MKKAKKKLLVTAVTTMLACTLSAGLVMTAFADEATKDHEFDNRNGDVVFEDFDRANLTGVVSTTTESLTNLGEAPYLRVKYDAMDAQREKGSDESDEAYNDYLKSYCSDRNEWIYKQGSGDFDGMQTAGAIKITMRAPEGDVEIGDLCLGIRGVDNEVSVAVKNFSELTGTNGAPLPALTDEWATYEISLGMSYEEETYPTTETPVVGTGSAAILGLHIFPVAEKAGAVDILSVEFRKTGDYQAANNFTGGDDVQATAKAANAATWWAGSANGSIVKRMPELEKGGDLLVVKESAVGKYAYAVIEAEGDVEHLKVATTTDGETFGEAVAYDGYSVALTGEEKGFKFTYDGEETVRIKRIYLTNLVAIVPDTATPVIDAKTAEYLDDFSVAQSGINGDWDAMSTAPEAAAAGMQYRLSYANGDNIAIKDGMLVIEAPSSGWTNFKFKSQKAFTQKYLVLKMKQEGEGATLNNFRFNLIAQDDVASPVLYANNFKSGVEYKSKLLTADNPYKDGDWYYVIIDIEETIGADIPEVGYSGMDMYCEGTGKLYFDEIFFADKKDLPDVEKDIKLDAKVEAAATTDYAYAYMYIPNDGTGKTLSFDITPEADGFNPSTLRLGFDKVGTYWGAENAGGTLITVDGKKLNELTYTAGTATKVVIDLEKSGIVGAFSNVHVHRDNIGAFTLDNVVLHTAISPFDAKDLDTENAVTVMDGETAKTITVTAPEGGYAYAGGLDVAKNVYGKLEFKFTPGEDFGIVNGIRLEFDGVGTRWASENDAGSLITTDGKRIDEFVAAYLEEHPDYANEPITVEIDLAASGITEAFETVHIHTNGAETGGFTLTDAKFTPYVDYLSEHYADTLDELPLYLDSVLPTVSITNNTTATVGDEITVAYTASDNATATADLKVEITVTKDGEAVTLDGGKFTAQEGTYTVTVKVTDIAGNEATDVKQITVSKKGTTTTPGATGGNSENKGLSTGAIVGIVIGCVAGVGLIVGGVFLALHLRKKKKENN